MGIFAPWLAPEKLAPIHLNEVFLPPIWAGGTWSHPFGTDQLGHDVLSQVIWGARTSLTVVALVVSITFICGTLLGLIAGYRGGWVDHVISRSAEVTLTIPQVVVGLVLVVSLGRSVSTIVIVLSLVGWVSYARVVRAEVVVLRNSDFVALATVAGLRLDRLLARHLLPSVLPSVLALATLDFGNVILYEASLSFIGLGVQPPNSSWGLMISTNYLYLGTHPWLLLIPSAMLVLTTLSGHLSGDILRERLDPRMRSLVVVAGSRSDRGRVAGDTPASASLATVTPGSSAVTAE